CHNGVCARATIHIIVGRDTDGDSDPDTTDPDDDNDGNPDVTDPNPLFAVANDDYMESIANYASEVNIITNDDFEVSSLLNVIFEESQYLGEMSFDNATGIFSYTPTVEEEDSEIDIDYEVCHNGICARATIHIIVGKDTDGDGISDEYDPDIDNDGTDNEDDENPLFAVANDDYSYAIAETAKIIDIITNDDFSISSSLIIYSDNLGSAQGNIYFDSTDGTLSYTAIISEINSEVTVNYTVCNISTNVCAEAVVYITIKEDVGEGAVNQLFTPNGDGVNDLFVIEGIEEIYPYYNMIVFNRYGNTVYEYSHNGNKELSPVWWDGTVSNSIHSKGEKGPPGVYFYLINYGVKGKIPLKGWVYLDE
ncbi:MAG: gliding motility-associated C-terminal domain-containing protein, partial [Flavobacteriaceae bacterium]|nr:gliding motility-associated C-terminal domain-containing protein [Flavobacteriaceae bacterium]